MWKLRGASKELWGTPWFVGADLAPVIPRFRYICMYTNMSCLYSICQFLHVGKYKLPVFYLLKQSKFCNKCVILFIVNTECLATINWLLHGRR